MKPLVSQTQKNLCYETPHLPNPTQPLVFSIIEGRLFHRFSSPLSISPSPQLCFHSRSPHLYISPWKPEMRGRLFLPLDDGTSPSATTLICHSTNPVKLFVVRTVSDQHSLVPYLFYFLENVIQKNGKDEFLKLYDSENICG